MRRELARSKQVWNGGSMVGEKVGCGLDTRMCDATYQKSTTHPFKEDRILVVQVVQVLCFLSRGFDYAFQVDLWEYLWFRGQFRTTSVMD